jgi:hypothetical protein
MDGYLGVIEKRLDQMQAQIDQHREILAKDLDALNRQKAADLVAAQQEELKAKQADLKAQLADLKNQTA